MRKGEYQDFAYTGGMQSFVVPNTGVYKLEVWGGSGACGYWAGYNTNAMGGYAVGYKKFKKGTTLYICVGGKGVMDGKVSGTGGYNGGGNGWLGDARGSSGNWGSAGPSGGATHMALVTGTLQAIGKETFDENGLIVAGGGASSMSFRSNGTEIIRGFYGNQGGDQTASHLTSTFGKGVDATGSCNSNGTWIKGPGGGGYYGGTTYVGGNWYGYGGSSWIDGVEDFKEFTKSMTMGGAIANEDGKARITLMQKTCVLLGDKECEVYLGETPIDEIYLGTIEIG